MHKKRKPQACVFYVQIYAEEKCQGSDKICDPVDQVLRIFPAKTGIRDGFSIDVLADFLAALLDIALDHDTLYEICQFAVVSAGMHDLVNDPDLFPELLVGIAVVRIHDARGIDQVALVVFFQQADEILVVIVREIGRASCRERV